MLSVVGFSLVVGPSGDETRQGPKAWVRQGQAKPRQAGKARPGQTRAI